MADNSFTLKNMADINRGLFALTDPAAKQKGAPVFLLPPDKLFPFKSHPFKPYTGQRFDDMVDSIRENGVHEPIIVRPIEASLPALVASDHYEILSGHNRVAAAKAAGLETIPAIVREGLSDEDALLIVTETNLLQRSFADLSHSERAVTLSVHHDAIKRQGRRTDLIQEIENMVNTGNGKASETFSPLAKKLRTNEEIGEKYGLSKDNLARYLRINKLIDAHKRRVDSGELAIRAAVALSYLSGDEQQTIDDILDAGHYKPDIKKAEALRAASEKRPLDHETAERILTGEKKPRASRPAAFKLKPKIVSKYFAPEQKPAEIEATVIEALEFFYAHKNQEGEVIPHSNENIPANDAAGEALPPEIAVG
jgi:ParB family chromosome partitioning protein